MIGIALQINTHEAEKVNVTDSSQRFEPNEIADRIRSKAKVDGLICSILPAGGVIASVVSMIIQGATQPSIIAILGMICSAATAGIAMHVRSEFKRANNIIYTDTACKAAVEHDRFMNRSHKPT